MKEKLAKEAVSLSPYIISLTVLSIVVEKLMYELSIFSSGLLGLLTAFPTFVYMIMTIAVPINLLLWAALWFYDFKIEGKNMLMFLMLLALQVYQMYNLI